MKMQHLLYSTPPRQAVLVFEPDGAACAKTHLQYDAEMDKLVVECRPATMDKSMNSLLSEARKTLRGIIGVVEFRHLCRPFKENFTDPLSLDDFIRDVTDAYAINVDAEYNRIARNNEFIRDLKQLSRPQQLALCDLVERFLRSPENLMGIEDFLIANRVLDAETDKG